MKRNFFAFLFFVGILFPLGSLAQSNVTVVLKNKDKYSVLDLHNRVRCQLDVTAQSMPNMTWNNLLYTVAQNYANKCVFAHNANRSREYADLGGQGYVGENIFIIGTPTPDLYLSNAVQAFASEKSNFAYTTSCGNSGICGCKPGTVCGHYTQLIWANSNTVACAQSDCSNTPLRGQLVVCNYSPGGNYIGTPPYVASAKKIDTAACQFARRVPLKFIATLSASSQQNIVSSILDGNVSTYWAPAATDPAPSIAMTFTQPINVNRLKIRWYDLNHAGKTVKIEYSTQADGSGLVALPPQALSPQQIVKVEVQGSQVRYLKINFLEQYSLKVRVATLMAMDPTFSWSWEKPTNLQDNYTVGTVALIK